MVIAARRLVVVSCSRRKRPAPEPLPAIERYDGPTFRLLRRYRRCYPDSLVDLRILSAEFGLIPPERPLPDYERRMTRARAEELRPAVLIDLRTLLSSGCYAAALLCLGRDYQHAIQDGQPLLEGAAGPDVRLASGPPGERLSALHRWLYGDHPAPPGSDALGQGRARLRGVVIELTGEEILGGLLGALAREPEEAERHHVWSVSIAGRLVGLKWAASRLTGLAPGAFHTDEAKRFARDLGLPIHVRDGDASMPRRPHLGSTCDAERRGE